MKAARIKISQFLLTFLVASAVWAADPKTGDTPKPRDWLKAAANPGAFQQNAQKLAETNFFEVRVTRLMTAVDRLKEKPALALTEEMARYYAGPLYKSEPGTKAYLVRALFANYTGMHTLYWHESRLLVRHDSLGFGFEPQFSPLVVNLPDEPKEVFVHVRGAR
jgi:hypothetical protein